MEKITSVTTLRESIRELEAKRSTERALMKEEFILTYEKLKPVNLIRSKVNDFIANPNLKSNIVDGILSFAVGYLSKKAVVGSTKNPLKQLFGTLVELGVISLVAKNSDGIKSTFMNVLNNFLNKKGTAN